MDHDSLYETDICTWAEQQAGALRGLASRADLPNELDLLNVVEEIEDVGIGQLRAVNSYMRLILSHMILIAAEADADSVHRWTREVATFRGELIQTWQPSMRRRIDMGKIWRHAAEEAVLKLSTYHAGATPFDASEVMARLGSAGIFDVDDLCGENLDFPEMIDRLRKHLSAG